MSNKPYILALNRINSLGTRGIIKLLKRWPNLEELFGLTVHQMEQSGIPKEVSLAIAKFNLNELDADWRWAQAPQHYLLTLCDSDYPSLLREIADPPVVLYAIGQLSSFQQPTVAIVGTRKPSISGSETAWRFASELARQQITIVSGLALGIDAQAHSGCLEAGGKTIGVMGTGIDCIYPRRHVKLAEQIGEKGLLLSEFPLQSPPIAGHFPRRNRIISGLSLATLVVEAAVRSGSLITARFALEQNRDVLAIPGSIYNPEAMGCHHLLQQGAKLVTSSHDVLEELSIKHVQIPMEFAHALAMDNENLVKFIGFELTTVDQIMLRSGLSIEEVVCNLAELELQGIVQAISGGYMRCTT